MNLKLLKQIRLFLFILIGLIAGWILYFSFGHMLIKAMYEGRSIGFLNNILEGRTVHSLEFYLKLADKNFITANIVLFTFFIFVWIAFILFKKVGIALFINLLARFFCLSALIVICSEIILRLFFPLYDIKRGRFQQDLPGLKKEILYETIGEDGFRALSVKDLSKRRNKRTIRILCLGASATFQSTQEVKDMWSAILERKLNDDFRSRRINIEVIAFGRGGLCVDDGRYFLINNLSKYAPDIVVCLWGMNDLCWKGGKDSSSEIPTDEPTKKLSEIRKNLFYDTQLYKRLKILKNRKNAFSKTIAVKEWHTKNLPVIRDYYQKLPYKEIISRQPDPIIEFKDELLKTVRYLKNNGVECILMAQPVLWKTVLSEEERKALWFYINTPEGDVRMSSKWLYNEMNKYNQVQKLVAEENDCTYIPLDTLIPKNLIYFFDDCHFTDKGSYEVALAISPYVSAVIEEVARNKKLIN